MRNKYENYYMGFETLLNEHFAATSWRDWTAELLWLNMKWATEEKCIQKIFKSMYVTS